MNNVLQLTRFLGSQINVELYKRSTFNVCKIKSSIASTSETNTYGHIWSNLSPNINLK